VYFTFIAFAVEFWETIISATYACFHKTSANLGEFRTIPTFAQITMFLKNSSEIKIFDQYTTYKS